MYSKQLFKPDVVVLTLFMRNPLTNVCRNWQLNCHCEVLLGLKTKCLRIGYHLGRKENYANNGMMKVILSLLFALPLRLFRPLVKWDSSLQFLWHHSGF
jgi:hypothetical protein